MSDVSAFVRRDADSGGGLSTSTIIIIAVVAACVVLLALALFAWRLLARFCRRSKNVPLPPAQDLARHREQQLSAFADRNARPTTWVDPSVYQPRPHLYSSHFLSASGSSTSLIRDRSTPDFSSIPSRGPTRENSWTVEDATSAESSPGPYPTPLSTEELMPPNPSYLPGLSMTSVASSSSDAISDAHAALPTSPSDMNHSAESSASNSPYSSPVRGRPPRASPSVSRSRSRPMSMVSSHTNHSLQTSHSVNTLRGPAHSIHSNIQIVLPAPLAPELYPHPQPHPLADAAGFGLDRTTSFYGGGDRRSVADPWLYAGSRPQSIARLDRDASSGSRMSSAGPRHSPSGSRPRSSLNKVSSLPDSDSASAKARRAQSQPPIPHVPSAPAVSAARARTPSPGPGPSSSSFAQPASPLPPVPRVPSQYGRAGSLDGRYDGQLQALQAAMEEPVRGRARDPVPLPAGAAAPVPVAAAPAPPTSYAAPRREPSGKLRKNRASTQDRRTSRS
ncbi:hypothetical protein K466DRAFT_585947 [Polyporus arcularius HHB13444]|uniref:Uncharacterized protein n=1 Tax=Polyporus arcularius HHB13444 TaxID=1314778 RepID=A0A5C3PGF0_9APHY|nr:hypothetical protein K466DRAFT_585947 [Polyporus arcularius HHB13444]